MVHDTRRGARRQAGLEARRTVEFGISTMSGAQPAQPNKAPIKCAAGNRARLEAKSGANCKPIFNPQVLLSKPCFLRRGNSYREMIN